MKLSSRLHQSFAVRRFSRWVGVRTGIHIRIKRYTPSASESLRVAMNIFERNIDCVIDVGANEGQFAQSLYDFGYKHKIISFEPVRKAHEKLVKRAKNYENWIVAARCAIGSTDSMTYINVSQDTRFSSLLSISAEYALNNPKSQIVDFEQVEMFSLDKIANRYLTGTEKLLLKIDTQGFEGQVLKGANKIIRNNVLGLKIEIPLYSIYQDAELDFFQTIQFVKDHGFKPYSFSVEGTDLNTGRVNTIDGLFFREVNP